jgi:hypothetical protein
MQFINGRYLVSLVSLSFLAGMILALPVLADEEGRPSDPNVVRGYLSTVGRDYVQIDSTRYTLSPNTGYTDEEGGQLHNGKGKMKIDMKVDLRLEQNMVVQVKIYGLLMR